MKINRVFKLGSFFLFTLIFSIFIVLSSLLIKQPADMPERQIQLGLPIHFYTLDYSGENNTAMSGAPDYYLEKTKFNINGAWEENAYISSWINFILSVLIVLATISICIFGINYIRRKYK